MQELNKLKSSLHGKCYSDKYDVWIKILSVVEVLDFHLKCELYKEFLQEYPFTFEQWNYYAQLYVQQGDNDKALDAYKLGLSLNRKSLKLWESYCSWVEDTFREDADLVKSVYDNALVEIGLDFYSGRIWDLYLRYLEKTEDIHTQNALYWRLGSVALKDIQSFVLRFQNFIEKIDDEETLKQYCKQLGAEEIPSSGLEALRRYLELGYERYVMNAALEAQSRIHFEDKLKQQEYLGKAISSDEKTTWINYINFEKNLSKDSPPKVLFIIEKSLAYAGTCPELWREYVNYLEHERCDRDYLRSILHRYRKMLLNIDFNLVFLLADLYELNGEASEAEDIYKELDSFKPKNVEISQRSCEFEIRRGNFKAAKEICEGIIFKSSLKIEHKIYMLGKLIEVLKMSSQTQEALNLFERACKELSYNRIILSLYVSFLEEFLPYEKLMAEVIRVFERAMMSAKKHSASEFKTTVVLFQKTIRKLSKEISFIFAIEKKYDSSNHLSLSKRFVATGPDADRLWMVLKDELNQELGKRMPEEELPDLSRSDKIIKGN